MPSSCATRTAATRPTRTRPRTARRAASSRSGRPGSSGGDFYLSDPDTGRRIGPDEAPSNRAAHSGARVENVHVDWHTPTGVRSVVASADTLPAFGDQPPAVVVCFEDVTDLRQAERRSGDAVALLDTLFDRAPVGFAYFDRDLRYVRVNDALAEMNGLPSADHVGRTVDELLPDMDPAVVAALRKVLESGEPLLEAEVHGATPASREQRTWLTGYYPVRGGDGVILGLGAVVVEITARKRAEAERERALAAERQARAEAETAAMRAGFLAEASVTLDRSLDYLATLSGVADLAVPRIADWCAVDVHAGGRLRNVAITHADPSKVPLGKRLMRDFYYPPDAPNGAPHVMRTGRPELLPEITDELLAANASSPEHYELLREFGMRSLMVVPMITRGHMLGTITFVTAESGRRFSLDDLTLCEDLARRAALAVDNSRLYSERAHIARTLQESLLPARLPELDGIEVAARFVPAGAGIEVGGDFYDVFEAGDGVSIVMGDVCGKGADAAALTALARYTLRATVDGVRAPSEVLEQLNRAVLQPARRRPLHHRRLREPRPPRRRRAPDAVDRRPPAADRPARRRPRRAGRHAGDADRRDRSGRPGRRRRRARPRRPLFLYTDGVTDARAPERILDTPDLAEIVAACGPGDPAALLAGVEKAIRDPGGAAPADDIAMLALRIG